MNLAGIVKGIVERATPAGWVSDGLNLPSKVGNVIKDPTKGLPPAYWDAVTKGSNDGYVPANNNANNPDGSGVNGANTPDPYRGGGNDTNKYSGEIGQLDAQDALLSQMLAKLQGQGTRDQGYANIEDSYNKGRNQANQQHGRALEDFAYKLQDTEGGRDNAIGKVETNARTLGDSLRRMIAQKSGSGSSAYQIAAPDAVARQAAIGREDAVDTYANNFRDIDVGKKRTEEDFGTLLEELSSQRNGARRDFESGLGDQINSIQGQRADIIGQKAAYQGGSPLAATAPIRADIASRDSQLDGLFNKYRNAVQPRDLKVDPLNLQDYKNDKATAQVAPAADANTNPYGTYLQKTKKDDELQV